MMTSSNKGRIFLGDHHTDKVVLWEIFQNLQWCLLVIILRTIAANHPVFMHGIELKTHLLQYTCPTPPAAIAAVTEKSPARSRDPQVSYLVQSPEEKKKNKF